jgi:hypothetical protein
MDETQQLLLWRWSTIVQLTSLAMVAAFFALLAHANPRPELRWWARAWTANLLALAATTIYWLVQSDAAFLSSPQPMSLQDRLHCIIGARSR